MKTCLFLILSITLKIKFKVQTRVPGLFQTEWEGKILEKLRGPRYNEDFSPMVQRRRKTSRVRKAKSRSR